RTGWKFKTPTICVMNGEPLMRKEWAGTIVLPGDRIEFISKPWGGGNGGSGKTTQIIGIVAVIALAAVAGPLALGINGALGLGLGASGLAVLKAGIFLGGSLLLSTFLRPDPGGQPA